jgi:enoyl-CoA hydratase/carnithine racemase
MGAELLSHTEGHTRVLTLRHSGQRNALHPDMYVGGLQALEQAERDADIRSVVLTGADGHFCAGGQLQRLQANRQLPPEAQAESIDALHRWIEALHHCPKPVVAAVEGACAGAGFSLALACDLVVAADNSRWVMAYANVGLSPDGGASWQLARQLPRATAMAWLLGGEPVPPERLHQLGLITRLSAPGQALADALRSCERLNAQAPNALASIKALVQAAGGQALQGQLDAERDAFVRNLHHPNAGEGIQAFFDKRRPNYRS